MAALVGMAVGFVSIWSQIRGQNRQAKEEAATARREFQKSIKDYLDLRLINLNMKIDHLKEDIARVEKKLNQYQERKDDG
jgi:septation ring formation regulator EzrA